MESKGRGRPKKEITYRKTVGVNVSQDEFLALQLISKNLGYKSISGFIRSAISKGIWISQTKGVLTSEKDIVHWQYFAKCWNMYQHFADNEELKAKEKSWADIFKSKQDNPKPPHIKGLEK
jgi:hypothetical protein